MALKVSTALLIGGAVVGGTGLLLTLRKGAFLPCINNLLTTDAEKAQCTADEKAARLAKTVEVSGGVLIAAGWITHWLGR
jgi:hypothetical protein